jgi:hypothetical protein
MPYSAVPSILTAESRRLIALPTYFQSLGSFSFTSVGTGSFDAASASWP